MEADKLHLYYTSRKFVEAEQLASQMLASYNRFDYELLLKRARIRQCLDLYDEAVLDAKFALQINPTRLEAFHILSDCLIATQNYEEAGKLLVILAQREPENQ